MADLSESAARCKEVTRSIPRRSFQITFNLIAMESRQNC